MDRRILHKEPHLTDCTFSQRNIGKIEMKLSRVKKSIECKTKLKKWKAVIKIEDFLVNKDVKTADEF